MIIGLAHNFYLYPNFYKYYLSTRQFLKTEIIGIKNYWKDARNGYIKNAILNHNLQYYVTKKNENHKKYFYFLKISYFGTNLE